MQEKKKTRGTMLVSTALILCAVSFAAGFMGGSLTARHGAELSAPPAPQQAAPAQEQGPAAEIGALRQAALASPEQASAWIRLGNACYDFGDPNGAIEAYEKALNLEPKNADVMTDMGSMYRMKGQADKAVECYDKAIALQPGHSNAIFNKGMTLMIDLGAPAKALAFWKSILEREPNLTLSSGALLKDGLSILAMQGGMHLEENGHPEAALEAYAGAMDAAPADVKPVILRAALLERLGLGGEAVPLWRKALKLDPNAVDEQGKPVRSHIEQD